MFTCIFIFSHKINSLSRHSFCYGHRLSVVMIIETFFIVFIARVSAEEAISVGHSIALNEHKGIQNIRYKYPNNVQRLPKSRILLNVTTPQTYIMPRVPNLELEYRMFSLLKNLFMKQSSKSEIKLANFRSK